MPILGSLEELWRRSLDLNTRYYGAIGRLTVDYLKELASTVSTLGTTQPTTGGHDAFGAQPPRPSHTHGAATSHTHGAQPSAAQSSTAGAMVLEGEIGSRVLGVFLVENHLKHEISARVIASAFIDESGRIVQPVLVFDPEAIVLGPGEQSLVRVAAVIDATLEPGVRYAGQFTIPELTGTRIPVVLRRRAGHEHRVIEVDDARADDATQPEATIRRRRRAKAKPAPRVGEREG
jgi:hypothetical protein